MSIRDLIESGIRLQGAYIIKRWDDAEETCVTLEHGSDFECEYSDIKEEILDAEIHYMYVAADALNIEIEMEE